MELDVDKTKLWDAVKYCAKHIHKCSIKDMLIKCKLPWNTKWLTKGSNFYPTLYRLNSIARSLPLNPWRFIKEAGAEDEPFDPVLDLLPGAAGEDKGWFTPFIRREGELLPMMYNVGKLFKAKFPDAFSECDLGTNPEFKIIVPVTSIIRVVISMRYLDKAIKSCITVDNTVAQAALQDSAYTLCTQDVLESYFKIVERELLTYKEI